MDRETARVAKKFVERLKKVYALDRVILFGSRARGDHFKTSDFDFIIVSKNFSSIPFLERLSRMYDYWEEDVDVEAICYTPDEFSRKSREHGIVRRAVEESIGIA